jgi:6,7-dimethyl-8-ribityllumazine synthase
MQRKNHAKKISFPDGSRLRIGVVVSDFNADITASMLEGALATLKACRVKKSNVRVLHVPGGFEIPFGCLTLIKSGKYDALITLACVVKGETTHDVYIATAATNGIMSLSLQYKIPIAFGVLTTNNLAQAKARSAGKGNKGVEVAITAITMAKLHC